MNKDTTYISKAKKKELEEELFHLKNVRRGELADSLEKARALGDLSENAEYHQAREDQAWTEDRIAQVEHILRYGKVISDHPKSDSVVVGSTVAVTKKGERKETVYTIVGDEESDATKGKISVNSPLGKILLGKEVGDVATLKTLKAEIEYKIKSIN